MALAEIKNVVKLPEGVTATVTGTTITVKGGNAELTRVFQHPDLTVTQENGDLMVTVPKPRRKTRALAGTWQSHLENMVRGATKDFEYRLKVVYSHFPIKVKVDGDTVVIDNFIGEKTPRKARVVGRTKVKVAGEELICTGPEIEQVGQTAANIEQACRIRGYDLRVFQDGIYITNKAE